MKSERAAPSTTCVADADNVVVVAATTARRRRAAASLRRIYLRVIIYDYLSEIILIKIQ